MDVQYESSHDKPLSSFKDKHVHIFSGSIDAAAAKEASQKSNRGRTFVGKGAYANSVLCMSPGQSQALLSWIVANKAKSLTALKKGGMLELEDIKVYGAVIRTDNKTKKIEARAGGTIKLGFKRKTASIIEIVHFGGHTWKGSFVMADTALVDKDAKAT